MEHKAEPAADYPQTVLWMRGLGCGDLAELLAGESAIQIGGDPSESVIQHRADMIVMKRIGPLDLVPVAAPTGFDAEAATHIVAAVGRGPHSRLATVVAGRLSRSLDIPVEAVTAVRPGAARGGARRILDRARDGLGIPGRVVETDSESGLLELFPPSTLLVLGAPGGSWLHRQFFGPGARLRTHAPAGTIVIRDAPVRAFRFMAEPDAVSVHLRVRDALTMVSVAVTPVVSDGELVGIIRKERLAEASPDAEVAEIMETPAFVDATDAIDDLTDVADFYEHSPIPLVDRKGRLVGTLDPERLPED